MSNSKVNMRAGRLLCKFKIGSERMNIMDKVLENLVYSKDIKTLWIQTNMERNSCHQIKALAR
jgi:hypothetical protein